MTQPGRTVHAGADGPQYVYGKKNVDYSPDRRAKESSGEHQGGHIASEINQGAPSISNEERYDQMVLNLDDLSKTTCADQLSFQLSDGRKFSSADELYNALEDLREEKGVDAVFAANPEVVLAPGNPIDREALKNRYRKGGVASSSNIVIGADGLYVPLSDGTGGFGNGEGVADMIHAANTPPDVNERATVTQSVAKKRLSEDDYYQRKASYAMAEAAIDAYINDPRNSDLVETSGVWRDDAVRQLAKKYESHLPMGDAQEILAISIAESEDDSVSDDMCIKAIIDASHSRGIARRDVLDPARVVNESMDSHKMYRSRQYNGRTTYSGGAGAGGVSIDDAETQESATENPSGNSYQDKSEWAVLPEKPQQPQSGGAPSQFNTPPPPHQPQWGGNQQNSHSQWGSFQQSTAPQQESNGRSKKSGGSKGRRSNQQQPQGFAQRIIGFFRLFRG